MTDLDQRLERLEVELAAARRELADTRRSTTSRRGAIRAAIVGLLGVGAVSARPAAAADGSSLQLGAGADANNTATSPTMLTYAGPALTDRSALSVGAAPSAADEDTAHPAAVGGYAKGPLADGVHGSTNRVDGYGVVAINKSAFPLDARGAVAVLVESSGGHIQLVGGGGDLDQPGFYPAGTLVYSDVRGLGFWVPGGPLGSHSVLLAKGGSAGAFQILTPPVRVYDSRMVTGPAATGDGPLAGGEERTIHPNSVTGSLEGTTGLMLNVTITETRGAGFLAVFSADTGYPGTSNINWSTDGQTLANLVVTSAIQGDVTLHAGGPGATQIVIDLIGVYG